MYELHRLSANLDLLWTELLPAKQVDFSPCELLSHNKADTGRTVAFEQLLIDLAGSLGQPVLPDGVDAHIIIGEDVVDQALYLHTSIAQFVLTVAAAVDDSDSTGNSLIHVQLNFLATAHLLFQMNCKFSIVNMRIRGGVINYISLFYISFIIAFQS